MKVGINSLNINKGERASQKKNKAIWTRCFVIGHFIKSVQLFSWSIWIYLKSWPIKWGESVNTFQIWVMVSGRELYKKHFYNCRIMGRFIYRAFLLYLSLLYKLPQSHLLIKCFLFNIYILIDASESNLGFSILPKDILAASVQNTAPAFQLLDVLLYFLSYSHNKNVDLFS